MKQQIVLLIMAFFFVACGGSDSNGDTAPPPPDDGQPSDMAPPPPDDGQPSDTLSPPDDSKVPPTDSKVPPGEVTYFSSVKAILEANCLTCHGVDGIGPMPLNDYDSASSLASLLAVVVADKTMPPWMPDPNCRPMQGERLMADAEIEAVVAWADAGAPEGDPQDYVPPEIPQQEELGPPSLLLKAANEYMPNANLPDDYRCLVLDHNFSDDTYLTAVNVIPDQTAVVHHVLLYLVPPQKLAELETLEALDPHPGYTCFGGPGVSDGGPLGGWAPGMMPAVLPDGAAQLVPAGSRIVMQLHYNMLGLPDGAPVLADRTEVALWQLPKGSTPTDLVHILPLANGEISIVEGDPNSVQSKSFDMFSGAELIGVAPHMHLLGTSINVDLARANGTNECVVDVPEWDFNWQQFYLFEPSSYLTVGQGEDLVLTCVYDNSAPNQPVVNGEQLSPKHVTWGEGTLDEMCLNYVILRTPFSGTGQCKTLVTCTHGCPTGDSLCFSNCLISEGSECRDCVLSNTGKCAAQHCPTEAQVLNQCLQGCENIGLCLLQECNSQYDTLYKCLEPHFKGGGCDSYLEECGVVMGSSG